jgi:hypothetical protein
LSRLVVSRRRPDFIFIICSELVKQAATGNGDIRRKGKRIAPSDVAAELLISFNLNAAF